MPPRIDAEHSLTLVDEKSHQCQDLVSSASQSYTDSSGSTESASLSIGQMTPLESKVSPELAALATTVSVRWNDNHEKWLEAKKKLTPFNLFEAVDEEGADTELRRPRTDLSYRGMGPSKI